MAHAAPRTGLFHPSRWKMASAARSLIQRVSWGIGDQAVSSMTNFAISVYAAKELPASQFGTFSLVYITYAFILNASRGLATEPLLVRHSGEPDSVWRAAVAQSGGMALSVGIVSGAISAGVGLVVGGEIGRVLLALAIGLPGLMLQDSWRYAFFSVGRGSRALINDCIWALALIPAILVVHRGGHITGVTCMLAWGAAGLVAAIVGIFQTGIMPHLAGGRAWLVKNWDLCPRYMAENLSIAGARQLRYTGLALFGGFAAVGHLRAAEVLLGPFGVLLMGVSLVAIPEAVTVLRRWPHRLRTFCVLLGGGEAAAVAIWGLAVILLLPHGLGSRVLGPIWKPASPLLLPAVLGMVCGCFSVGANAGLHALGQAKRSLRAQAIWSGMYLVGGLVGAAFGGALGTSWGVVGATFLGAVNFQRQLNRGIAEYLANPPAEPPHSTDAVLIESPIDPEIVPEVVPEVVADVVPEIVPEPASQWAAT
jgi:O-antigen/teichoic acid export membrane protein